MRLRRLEEDFGPRLAVEWRSFLLRPRPEPRSLEQFRAYTRSWLRPASEPDAAEFRVWTSSEGPPTHSVPPHLAAKAAARLGADAFRRMHAALLRAYFVGSRDITRAETLRAIWLEEGLPPAAFEDTADPALVDAIVAEHNAAVGAGVTGVPAALVAGTDTVIPGALPLAVYRRWIERTLAPPRG